jgi:RNA 2',3'-cyclic 3'-phosphodiesterase
VPLGDDARKAVRDLVDRLRADSRVPGAARLRWAVSDNLHLTMRFLGATPPARVPDVVAAADAAVAGLDPIDVRLAGGGAFPSAARPRVVWLGISRGAPELARLAGRLGEELAARGWAPDDRPFRAHLTLGRSDGIAGAAEAVAALELAARDLDAAWTADRLVVYRSVLGHGPPQYEPLAAARLEGDGLPARPSLE